MHKLVFFEVDAYMAALTLALGGGEEDEVALPEAVLAFGTHVFAILVLAATMQLFSVHFIVYVAGESRTIDSSLRVSSVGVWNAKPFGTGFEERLVVVTGEGDSQGCCCPCGCVAGYGAGGRRRPLSDAWFVGNAREVAVAVEITGGTTGRKQAYENEQQDTFPLMKGE